MENSGVKSMLLADTLLLFCLKRYLNKPRGGITMYGIVCTYIIFLRSRRAMEKEKEKCFFSAASIFIILYIMKRRI